MHSVVVVAVVVLAVAVALSRLDRQIDHKFNRFDQYFCIHPNAIVNFLSNVTSSSSSSGSKLLVAVCLSANSC